VELDVDVAHLIPLKLLVHNFPDVLQSFCNLRGEKGYQFYSPPLRSYRGRTCE